MFHVVYGQKPTGQNPTGQNPTHNWTNPTSFIMFEWIPHNFVDAILH